MDDAAPVRFDRFADFYPYYLGEHEALGTRISHALGTLLMLGIVGWALIFAHPLWCFAGIGVAYLFAWTGHLLIERNRPATFRHPLYSAWADVRMTFELLTFQRPWREATVIRSDR